ncbi:MAG TPA: recombinase, partial [Candidatus Bathyarchaeota archaeon]|nr:recombinase [Candidatus Bathyarchaeota archaeon]
MSGVVEMSSNRVKTGISSLDEIMEGGFPPGRVYIVAGEAGTGK